jgi:hypothetical protein
MSPRVCSFGFSGAQSFHHILDFDVEQRRLAYGAGKGTFPAYPNEAPHPGARAQESQAWHFHWKE